MFKDNVLLYILFSVNSLYIVYFIVKSMQFYAKFLNAKKREPIALESKNAELYKNKIILKILSAIFILIMIAVFVAVVLIPSWLPIVIWIFFGAKYGLIAILFFSTLAALGKIILVVKKTREPKVIEEAVLNEILTFFTIFLAIFLFTDLRGLSLESLISTVYFKSISVSIPLMIFLPILYYSIILTNVYVIIKRSKMLLIKVNNKYKQTTFIDVVVVLNISAFLGLMYINVLDLSYMTTFGYDSLKNILNIYLALLTAFLIPLVFHLTNKKNETKNYLPSKSKYRQKKGSKFINK